MKKSSRLKHLADEVETRRLRNPKLGSWRALRAQWLGHVSSRMQVRILTMTRVETLPVEDETGRWNKVAKEQRICKNCKAALGTTHHFLHECTALQTAKVPGWLDCPRTEKYKGHWWRDTAKKLEVRWREKCTIGTVNHENTIFTFLAEKMCESELYFENTDLEKYTLPTRVCVLESTQDRRSAPSREAAAAHAQYLTVDFVRPLPTRTHLEGLWCHWAKMAAPESCQGASYTHAENSSDNS